MAVTITLGSVDLGADTCFVRAGGLDLSRLAEGRVLLSLEMSGATRDAAETVRRNVEAQLISARLMARSAAGPLDGSARVRLAINIDQTDTSYISVYGGGFASLLYSDVYPLIWGQLELITDPYVHGAETEQTITASLTNGNASAAFYSSIPGDLPALVRAQIHDLSSSGALNRIRLSTFGRSSIASTDIDTIMSLTAASGASTTADANSINATNYARESITAAAAANTVAEGYIPAELARGPLDIWVRNRGASATLPTVNTPSLAANTWIAPRQVAYGTTTNATTTTPSFSQDSLKGSTLVLSISTSVASGTAAQISSISGATWTLAGSCIGTNIVTYQYYIQDAATWLSATVTSGTSCWWIWTVQEFDKVPKASFDRAVSLITSGSGTSIVAGTTDSTRQPYEIAVSQVTGFKSSASAPTFTQPSGTERSDQSVNNSPTNTMYTGAAVNTYPTTVRGTQALTYTASATCSQRHGIMCTYRALGGLTAGSYAVKLVAVNTDGSKSAASASASQTITAGQAVTVTITGTATAYYEVWWQRDGGQWFMQRTDGPVTTYYIYLETGTPGTPPTLATYNTLYLRLAYGLRSATVLSYTDWVRSHPSAIGWGFPWSGIRTNARPFTLTLAPSPTITNKPAEDWYVAVQGYSPDVTGNLDIDGLWLAHHGSPQFEAWHQASDGTELSLSSRAIWDIDRRHDGRHSVVLQGTHTLTASGNEITDVTRRTGTQGDGKTTGEHTVGVWKAATNLLINGGFTTNTTGWNNSGGTISRVTTQYKFGTAGGQIVTDNAAANEGAYHAFTGAAATQYTVSAWVRGSSGTVRVALYDNVSGKQASSAVTLSTTWQRISKTATTGGGAATFRVYVETDTQQNITFQIDGVQVETGDIATPYVETDGGTATRSAGRVRIPATASGAAIDETTGAMVVRVRMDHSSASKTSGNGTLWSWYDDASNFLEVRYDYANARWEFQRRSGGGTVEITSADTFALGDVVTVGVSWATGSMGLSVDGAAQTTNTGTQYAPTLAATTFDVGSSAGSSNHIDGSIMWLLGFAASLSDANHATIHAYGNTDPQRIDLDPTWSPRVLWDAAVSTSAGTGLDVGQARQRGDLLIEPGNALVTLNAEVASGISDCQNAAALIRLWTTPRFTRLIGDA